MNENLLKLVLEHERFLIPLIFTRKQLKVLRKKAQGNPLENAERKAMSASIIKKMEALSILCGGRRAYISGYSEILPGRLEEAELILEEYASHGKAFIAGSFLFSKEYNDIDVFIITRGGYREEWQGKRHLIFLSEHRLSSPIFQSAALISVGNFPIPQKLEKKRPKLENLMSDYHEAVIEKMKKDKKQEASRRLAFAYLLFVKREIPHAKKLAKAAQEATLPELDRMIRELCLLLFSHQYLYIGFHTYIKTLKESIRRIHPHEHLLRYKSAYEGIIYGRERNEAQAA